MHASKTRSINVVMLLSCVLLAAMSPVQPIDVCREVEASGDRVGTKVEFSAASGASIK